MNGSSSVSCMAVTQALTLRYWDGVQSFRLGTELAFCDTQTTRRLSDSGRVAVLGVSQNWRILCLHFHCASFFTGWTSHAETCPTVGWVSAQSECLCWDGDGSLLQNADVCANSLNDVKAVQVSLGILFLGQLGYSGDFWEYLLVRALKFGKVPWAVKFILEHKIRRKNEFMRTQLKKRERKV